MWRLSGISVMGKLPKDYFLCLSVRAYIVYNISKIFITKGSQLIYESE